MPGMAIVLTIQQARVRIEHRYTSQSCSIVAQQILVSMPGDIPRADQLGAFGGIWWKRSFFGITSSLLVKVLVKEKVLVASQLSLLEKMH